MQNSVAAPLTNVIAPQMGTYNYIVSCPNKKEEIEEQNKLPYRIDKATPLNSNPDPF